MLISVKQVSDSVVKGESYYTEANYEALLAEGNNLDIEKAAIVSIYKSTFEVFSQEVSEVKGKFPWSKKKTVTTIDPVQVVDTYYVTLSNGTACTLLEHPNSKPKKVKKVAGQ